MPAEDMRDAIEDFTRAQFAFLEESKEFRRAKVTRTSWFTKFTYKHRGEAVAFELVLEFYDQSITERLTNLRCDQESPQENVGPPSQRSARSFVGATRDILHAPESELTQYMTLLKAGPPWDSDTYMAIIAAISVIVCKHFHELMEQPPDVLFELRPAPHN